MSFHLLRKRVPSEPVILADYSAAHGDTGVLKPPNTAPPPTLSGALSRIMHGVFGVSNDPRMNLSAEVTPYPGKQGLYHYHEGDLFTPGAENYVFEYPFEYPLQTIWGHAFLRGANSFNPQQPPQIYSQANVRLNGLGGLQAGQFAFQPLETDGE